MKAISVAIIILICVSGIIAASIGTLTGWSAPQQEPVPAITELQHQETPNDITVTPDYEIET